jgi:hypothetical protein
LVLGSRASGKWSPQNPAHWVALRNCDEIVARSIKTKPRGCNQLLLDPAIASKMERAIDAAIGL